MYGFVNNVDGYVNINPNKKCYTTVDNNGTDLIDLDFIPAFWKNRISEVVQNKDFVPDPLSKNDFVLRLINCGRILN